MNTHYHICPRNCYDTCSIISSTRQGSLVGIRGNPDHPYTAGKLCAKAIEEVNRVYSPQRVKYPLRQRARFSGQWERISWDEALDLIARQILSIKKRYGSTLPIALNKYSGNFGILHKAIEGLFSGLGPTTKAIGSPCWSAGIDAQTLDFGTFFCSDPLDMEKAKLILVWGANPAWNAVHQMPVIFRAVEHGAKLVVIDTHFTATAARAHQYIQVKAGTDGMLALGMAKVLVEYGLIDPDLEEYSLGHEEFLSYLEREISLDQAAEITGVPVSTMTELALDYGRTRSACIWAGFGLQRYSNGGQTIRAIDALAALSGHIGEEGGGVQYAQMESWRFSGVLTQAAQIRSDDRVLNINRFAQEALACDPPLNMLWIACRNPLQQDSDQRNWLKLIDSLELIVVSDLFHSKSTEAADLFLPVTTHYEHWDVNASYWHYFVGINEPAIPPVGEAHSDLQIAWDLAAYLNQRSPGSCSFPVLKSEKEAVLQEIGPEMLELLGMKSPEELLHGPRRMNFAKTSWQARRFNTPSGKFEFSSARAKSQGLPALPQYLPPKQPSPQTPLRLLTPHHPSGINSQFYALNSTVELIARLSGATAQNYDLADGQRAILWNQHGSLKVLIKVEQGIPPGLVVIYQENRLPQEKTPNVLTAAELTDMGILMTGAPGMALNETFVNLKKI